MNIRIQVRHDAAREAIQKYITAEFEHISSKYSDITSAEFIVDHEGPNGHTKTFEAIIHVPGETITVKESEAEAHVAIEVAMKVLEKRLNRHKETHAHPGNLLRHEAARHPAPVE
jgi:ribosomal subunit interface protein